MIPPWLKRYMKPVDRDRIVAAIRHAEAQTSGEIVPMIVGRSATIGHVPVLVFALLFIVFLGSGLNDLQMALLGLESPLWWLGNAALFSGLSLLIARSFWVQRHLTSEADLATQVQMRAEVEFYDAGLHHTTGGTGVLIFLSMMEHKVIVLADKSIADKLPQQTWSGVVDHVLAGIKQQDLAAGLAKAIEECGGLLRPHFPRAADDQNELRDQLIIKD